MSESENDLLSNPQLDLFGGSAVPDREPAKSRSADTPGPSESPESSKSPEAAPARQTQAPAGKPQRRARDVRPAPTSEDLLAIARALPAQVHLGTSSWSFPGWEGIVYAEAYSDSKLSRDGLAAYGAHPLLRTVSIDRSFYAPLGIADYLRYAQQVPDSFRFIVKAPAAVTDATVRAGRGEPVADNPSFLDAGLATSEFVEPCLAGLGAKAGALVFQFPPLPARMLADPAPFVAKLADFFDALPPLRPRGIGLGQGIAPVNGVEGAPPPCYAIEIRDACLLTPRLIRMLREHGVRYCVGLHARMPDPLRQAAALALLDGEAPAGALVIRWSLHGGFKYEQAKAKYEPFNRLVDEDTGTRMAVADLAARYALAGQPVLIVANNKAEGSAPLSCIALAREIAAACAPQ